MISEKMNRYQLLKHILDQGQFFKVVCGAGNEDPQEVFRLCATYTLAGAFGIDLSANVEIVEAGMQGIDFALQQAEKINIPIDHRPFITVSVGIKGDPHVRKAKISDDRCSQCRACLEHCDQGAIEENPISVIEKRCIGCGKCEEVCEFDAVGYYTRKVDFEKVLPACLDAGAENLELHAIIDDDQEVMKDWQLVNRLLPDQFISMCLDRSQLSDQHLLRRIQEVKKITGDRLIIQADGAPMSGGSDDFNTTLQAIAIADIINKGGIEAQILLSGGTNSKSGEMAKLCGVGVSGVSIGTYARNLVREEIEDSRFETDQDLLKKAVKKAAKLVEINMKYIKRG